MSVEGKEHRGLLACGAAIWECAWGHIVRAAGERCNPHFIYALQQYWCQAPLQPIVPGEDQEVQQDAVWAVGGCSGLLAWIEAPRQGNLWLWTTWPRLQQNEQRYVPVTPSGQKCPVHGFECKFRLSSRNFCIITYWPLLFPLPFLETKISASSSRDTCSCDPQGPLGPYTSVKILSEAKAWIRDVQWTGQWICSQGFLRTVFWEKLWRQWMRVIQMLLIIFFEQLSIITAPISNAVLHNGANIRFHKCHNMQEFFFEV